MRAGILIPTVLLSFALTSFGHPAAQRLLASDSVHVRYYDVTAADLASLGSALLAAGPRDAWNKARYAATAWTIRWRLTGAEQKARVQTEIEIQVSLPRWHPTSAMSPSEYSRWSEVYRSILLHEWHHAEMPRKTARRIETEINRAAAERGILASDASAIARRLISENNEWDLHYDRVTGHGRKQGIMLPES